MPARSHGLSRDPKYATEYAIWSQMRQRCMRPKHPEYHNYGARGITVCAEWADFTVFYADMGPKPEGLSLDREDNDKGYSKGNCRWATQSEQNANKRITFPINTKHADKHADMLRLHAQGLSSRKIAERLGISKSWVHKFCAEMGS